MSSAHEDAAKFAYFWEGSELVAYESVGVPLWVTTLEVLVQRRKPVAPIDEFALRTVQLGLSTLDSVSGLLGLEPTLAQEAVLSQLQAGHLSSEVSPSGQRSLVVTTRGEIALQELASYAPERQESYVVYDRVLRKVTGADDRGLLRPRDLEARSLRARPPVSSPRIGDISIDEVADVLAKAEGERKAKRKASAEYQLIGIKRVVRSERRYKPATLLVYESKKGRYDAGIVIDGRPSRVHTAALSELGGLRFLEIDEGQLSSGKAWRDATERLPSRLRSSIWSSGDLDDALRQFVQARRRLRDPDVVDDEAGSKRTEDSARAAAEAGLREAGASMERAPARRVPAWEHWLLLEWLAATARERLVLASPQLTSEAVAYDLLRLIEDAIGRGVRVTVVLPSRTRSDVGEGEARRRLADLASRRNRLTIVESATPESFLMSDGRCVVGGFPWLGHVGDPEGRLICVESILVADRDATTEVASEAEARMGCAFAVPR